MIKHIKYHLIALLLSAFFLQAQSSKLEWGANFENRLTQMPDFYGKVGTELRGVYYSKRTYYVTRYDFKSLTKLEDVPVFGREINKNSDVYDNHRLVAYRGIKDNLFIFTVDYDKKNDLSTLYCTKIDKNFKAAEPQIIDQVPASKRREAFVYDIYTSTDSSKFTIMKNIDVDKNEKDIYSFKIIDVSTLKTVSNFNYTMPSAEKNTTFVNLLVNKDGVVFILALIRNENVRKQNKKKSKEEKIEKISYRIITANPTKNYQAKDFQVSIPGKDIFDLRLRHNANTGKVYGLAYYSNLKNNGNASWGIHGLAYLAIDEERVNIENSSFKDFPKNIVEELEGSRAARKNKGIDGTFEIKHVLTKPDGGMYFIMENEFIREVTTCNSQGQCRTTYYYYNEEVLVTSYSPKGGIEWYCVIPKHQVTTNDGGILNSIYAHEYNGKLHLVFNGSKKMIKKNSVKEPMNISNGKKAAIIDVVIDKKGDYQITEVNNAVGKQTYVIMPKFADKIGPKEAVFIGLKNKKNKLLRMMCYCCNFIFGRSKDDKKLAKLVLN